MKTEANVANGVGLGVKTAILTARVQEALQQYRNDMLYPPALGSRERRIAMIDATLAALRP